MIAQPTLVVSSPVSSVETEIALLGALIADNALMDRVPDELAPDQFADPINGKVFEHLRNGIDRGRLVDAAALRVALSAEEGADAVLAGIVSEAGFAHSVLDYGERIVDLHRRRALRRLGGDLREKVDRAGLEPCAIEIIENTEQDLYQLADAGQYGGALVPLKTRLTSAVEMVAAAHERADGLAGLSTGFVDVDKLLGGLADTDFIVAAGRPAMGKTALWTNISYHAARRYEETGGEEGAVVAFFSLEMSGEQLAQRILSEQTEIPSDRMRRGKLTDEEFNRLFGVSRELAGLPLFIDDSPNLTVGAIRARARRLKRQHGLGLVVVDYLQLMTDASASRNDGRVQEVSAISRGLKNLAKELHVPVVALSQLSRKVEEREDKRPLLSDLRESGSIEQDADVVMFLYRPEYYLRKPEQHVGETMEKFSGREAAYEEKLSAVRDLAELIIGKQRHGPTGTVPLIFLSETTRFCNFATDPGLGL